MPYEGDADLVSNHLQPVATAAMDEQLAAVRGRAGDGRRLVVTAADGTVVGTVDPHAFAQHRDEAVGDIVDVAPTTVRPSEERAELDERMAANSVDEILVTSPAGRLLGVYRPLG